MIQILFENCFFIILFKPAGTSVHNQAPSLLEFLKSKKMPEHFVNRLDSETSGLVVVAQNEKIHEPLQLALHHGLKKYRALLRGSMILEPNQTINWSWPVSDKSEGRRNPQGESNQRKESLTEIKVIRKNKYFTEVEIILKTGRQHQIRKHSALAKHPLVGDPRYNDEKYNLNINKFYSDPRLQLEAEELIFEFMNEKHAFNIKSLKLDSFFSDKLT